MATIHQSERQAELAEISAVLAARRPAVVGVTGEAGSGKSFVTGRAVQAAAAAGWRVTPYRNGRGVRVGKGTTDAILAIDLAAALGLPAPADRRNPLRAVAETLIEAAAEQPVLAVLDPYRPSPELSRRLTHELLPVLRRGERPVVVVVVTRRSLHDELHPEVEVAVASPDVGSIERVLRAATAGLQPPVDDRELAAYIEAARDDPRLLASLVAVLPLGQRGAGHVLPSPTGRG